MQPERGDVVRSVDPFKLGEETQRPWLIINNSSHPFGAEQHIAVAISTSEHSDSIALDDTIYQTGGVPEQSYASPWAVHSPRTEDLIAWQGRVEEAFVDRVVSELETYFR